MSYESELQLFEKEFSTKIKRRIIIVESNIVITTHYFNIDVARECLTLEESTKLKEALSFWQDVSISFFFLDNKVSYTLPSYVDSYPKINFQSNVECPELKKLRKQLEAKAGDNKRLKEILKNIELKAMLSGVGKREVIEEDIYKSSDLSIFLNDMASPIMAALQEKMDSLVKKIKEVNSITY